MCSFPVQATAYLIFLSDWTLHSHPAPTYASYRLLVTLRLLHVSLQDQTSVRSFEQMLLGQLEKVSDANEARVEASLEVLCTDFVASTLTGARALAAFEGSRQRTVGLQHELATIRFLWEEQRGIAEGLLSSMRESS